MRFVTEKRIFVILALVVLYLVVLFRNLDESERRSLHVRREVSAADLVHVRIDIINVNINSGEVTARLKFRLSGSIAENETTPSVNLKFLVNTVHGQQEVEFRRREGLRVVEAVFYLDGDSNKYPFDTYQTSLAFLVTRPASGRRPAPAAAPAASKAPGNRPGKAAGQKAGPGTPGVAPPKEEPAPTDVLMGAAGLAQNESVPIAYDLSASVPGIKFQRANAAGAHEEVTDIALSMRRADNVIVISILVMAMMMCLAMSLVAMTLHTPILGQETSILPLTISVSLIFGLPALRNAQPSVPPLGVLSDYMSFLWAELLVSASAVILVWRWIFRSVRARP